MKVLVLGAGGFIGNQLVSRLKREGHYITGIDLRYPLFGQTDADNFVIGDLRDKKVCQLHITSEYDEVYQLAADMGGAGYLFTGENDFQVMHNSASINLNVVECAIRAGVSKLFYSSSACIYPKCNQLDPSNPNCIESSAYPADPDSEYGWEKLFSERLYQNASKAHKLDVRIARFHNVYGPGNEFSNNKAKAPAAICRKVAMAENGESIEIWGPGTQTRSFLYIDDCLDGILELMDSEYSDPVNIGSEEMISINDFAQLAINISGKNLTVVNIDGPIGVNGRNSNNDLIRNICDWEPKVSLSSGAARLYKWVEAECEKIKLEPIIKA
ncbi:MAG: NAD-dependent epimerase/dehydratase family protein [Salibacteraceae bacterium]